MGCDYITKDLENKSKDIDLYEENTIIHQSQLIFNKNISSQDNSIVKVYDLKNKTNKKKSKVKIERNKMPKSNNLKNIHCSGPIFDLLKNSVDNYHKEMKNIKLFKY